MIEGETPLWTIKADESRLSAIKREYEQQQHPWFLFHGLDLCRKEQHPPPDWLVDALAGAVSLEATKRPARGCNSPSETSSKDKVDLIRALTVDLLRYNGVPHIEVFQAAADRLSGDPNFAGSDTAMRNSWRRVKRRSR